jgi:TorA maturation chaperone TorD
MNQTKLELAPLLARRELWLLVSVASVDCYHRQRMDCLMDPGFRGRTLKAAALMAEEYGEIELGYGEVSPAELRPQELFAAYAAESEAIERVYHRLFGLTAVSFQCPACETEFEPNTDQSYRSHRLADIAGFYSAFGFALSSQAGERLDHISVEAEFLYLLLAKEAAALQAGHGDGAQVCRDARLAFFSEHAGWWLPAFARLLSKTAPAGYYRELARLTAGVSTLERVSLGLPPFQKRGTERRVPLHDDEAGFNCVGACANPPDC